MTAKRRTLEEIEARYAEEARPGCKPVSQMVDDFPDLLAIAQGQREELKRLRKQIADDNELAKKAFGY